MTDLLVRLFSTFAPIVLNIVRQWKATHDDEDPTDAEVILMFQANVDRYLAEGAAWTAAHPRREDA